MRVLALTRYGPLGASSRLRLYQYIPALSRAGIALDAQPLFSDESLQRRYARGGYRMLDFVSSFAKRIATLMRRQSYDLLWIEKEALPWLPYGLEAILLKGVPYVLDFDDAVFHNYDQHRLGLVRRFMGDRIDQLMRNAHLVVCGNEYLAQRAKRAGAQWVEILETVIDEKRYGYESQSGSTMSRPVSIVWIGSPSTSFYLKLLADPLRELAQSFDLEIKVIGAQVELSGVPVRCLPWSEASEVSEIQSSDIGIMPLNDSAWELGKCGYKLIQYMACGLPVVASPVGVNTVIVKHGVNGYLASNHQEWADNLKQLIQSAALRYSMGQEGMALVERQYCLAVAAPKLIGWLRDAARRG